MLEYLPRRQPSYLQREAAAKQAQADRIENWEDPRNGAIRRVRAAVLARTQVAVAADLAFQKANAPVSAPKACGAGFVHPTRAAALANFTKGWSSNPSESIDPILSREEHAEILGTEAEAELTAANAALAALEAERRDEALACSGGNQLLDLDDDADDAVLDDMPVPRGRGRPRLSDEA